jgi:NhaP-type Na+/H+ or K+/H+ antiporter
MNLDAPMLTFGLAMAAGMIGQVLARHLRVPSIVLLLLVGVVLGPDVLNLIRPETLGGSLRAIVGASVAVILFEGGMHLDVGRLRSEAQTIRRLITVGAFLTALLATAIARVVMEWPWVVAVPFGTLVIVTGPTVITPLLRRIRVDRKLHTILEAEAVLIDPIGAIFAVVALEVVLAQEPGSATLGLIGFPTRLVFGTLVGAAAGFLLAKAVGSHRLIPRGWESIVTLAFLLALYATCEAVLPESGIMAAPIAGLVVGNMPSGSSLDLREFKQHLTVLLVGMLFMLLAADVRLAEVTALGWPGAVTVALLMTVVRPLAIAVSTVGANLSLREQAFLAWLGPRGIVAAAVASLFAEELIGHGVPEGIELRALVFLVIATTVMIQGLAGGLVAGLLRVNRRSNTGFMIAGANPLARAMAHALASSGEEVVLVDTDRGEVAAAKLAGFDAIFGNALDDEVLEKADLEGRAGVVALIPNEAVGLLVAEKARREFGVERADVALRPGRSDVDADRLRRIGGHILFGAETDLAYWTSALASGTGAIKRYRYTGDGERMINDGKDGEGAPGLFLTHERRGKSSPVNEASRLRWGDIVSILGTRAGVENQPNFEVMI